MKREAFLTVFLLFAAAAVFSQTDKFFGQVSPGPEPVKFLSEIRHRVGMATEVFAPGVVSRDGIQTKLTMSADGSFILYTERDPATNSMIFIIRSREGDSWGEPLVLPFSREWMNMEPSLAPDGARIVFVSNRPRSGTGDPEKLPDIWMAERAGGEWGKPVRLGPPICSDDAADIEAHPFIGPDGGLHFMRQSGKTRRLLHAAQRGNGFDEPVPLPLAEDLFAGQFSGPCLSPDGRILLMHSRKEGGAGGWDLYASFKDKAGSYGAFISLGPSINTPQAEADAFFSPDGHDLLFTRDGDIYRVSARILDNLGRRMPGAVTPP